MSGGDGSEKEEIEIAEEFLAGSLDAFREFFRRHAAEVLALSLRILRNRQDAEDVVSDVFFEMWNRRDKIDPRRSTLRSFLLMLARSRAIDRYRSRSRTVGAAVIVRDSGPEIIESAAPPVEKMMQTEAQESALSALKDLDDSQRKALELTFFEGMSHAQIASQLGIPLGTVKSHIRRGIAKLRNAIGDERSGRRQ